MTIYTDAKINQMIDGLPDDLMELGPWLEYVKVTFKPEDREAIIDRFIDYGKLRMAELEAATDAE